MGRIHEVTWDAATAVSAQIDVFEIAPADDKPVVVHGLRLWQTTDVGDAQEEIIGLQMLRGYTTSGSGGATAGQAPKAAGDGSGSFTAECRNTTLASTGTPAVLFADAWNVRAPYVYDFLPEHRPVVTQAQTALVVRLMAAPADEITMYAAMTVEELG